MLIYIRHVYKFFPRLIFNTTRTFLFYLLFLKVLVTILIPKNKLMKEILLPYHFLRIGLTIFEFTLDLQQIKVIMMT